MKRNYSILTEEDFKNHTHEELAKMQLDSLDGNILLLKKFFIILNVLLIIPFILLFLFETFLLSLSLLFVIIVNCVLVKRRMNYKIAIRTIVYEFLKNNNLVK